MTCSIGSLAKDLVEEGVQNVTVFKTVFTGTTNGFRIKSWARPSNGFVQGVRFIDAVMRNVQFPIVIDQNYCPHNLNCPGQVRETCCYFSVDKIQEKNYVGYFLTFIFYLISGIWSKN